MEIPTEEKLAFMHQAYADLLNEKLRLQDEIKELKTQIVSMNSRGIFGKLAWIFSRLLAPGRDLA